MQTPTHEPPLNTHASTKADEPANWQPQWSTQVKIESGGRYPLGLNRFHEGLEEILIKSIVLNANRLRYITYYCWAIGDIENREDCAEYSDFVEAFQRRENALALGLCLLNPEYSVPGSSSVSKILEEDTLEYDCSFDLMQSNELGAFGLYYKGTIYNLGLSESDEKGIVTLTQKGWELHKIAERTYSKTRPEYYREYVGKKQVPSKVLLEWGQVNDLDNIRGAQHKEERECFKSVLFRLEKRKAGDYRRDTLTFFLECIERCSKTNTKFSEDVLRNIQYYSCHYDNNKLRDFAVPQSFGDVHFYWFVYEGHVYFRWWLSRYFEIFLNHLKSRDRGTTINEFFAEIDASEFNRTISHFCGRRKDYFNTSMKTVIDLFQDPPNLEDAFSEEGLTQDDEFLSPSSILAKFLLVMLGILKRFQGVRLDQRYQYVLTSLETDLWFDVLYRFSNLEKLTVQEFLTTMLKKYIIDQHDLIMIEKNDLRRCWFTTENEKYFFQADVSLIWRPAKYQTIINFLSDMNLIQTKEEIIQLSETGKTFFQTLKSEYY
jgi:hypothetical protein